MKRRKRGKTTGMSQLLSGSDPDQNFIINKCALYLKRYLQIEAVLDASTLEMLCWSMGPDIRQIGSFLLELMNPRKKDEFENDFWDCRSNVDDYAEICSEIIRQFNRRQMQSFHRHICRLLDTMNQDLKNSVQSDLEKNVGVLQRMFQLTADEIEFSIFFSSSRPVTLRNSFL